MALLINDRLHRLRRLQAGLPQRGDQRRRPDLRDRPAEVHRMRRRRGRAAVQAGLPGRLHRARIPTGKRARTSCSAKYEQLHT